MEKKEYVTPSMRLKEIETSEILLGSQQTDTKDPEEDDSGNDMGAKQNFNNNAWDNE